MVIALNIVVLVVQALVQGGVSVIASIHAKEHALMLVLEGVPHIAITRVVVDVK